MRKGRDREETERLLEREGPFLQVLDQRRRTACWGKGLQVPWQVSVMLGGHFKAAVERQRWKVERTRGLV